MTKDLLLQKVESGDYTPEKLIKWVQCLPTVSKKEPTKWKRGDVFFHPMFHHPYVLLEFRMDDWLCGLLTTDSDSEYIHCPTDSRFYDNQFFTKVLFTVPPDIPHRFRGVYENNRHLRKVLKSLKNIIK